MSERYKINEIFYSPQGEGARAGTLNVFLRFSVCNLRCDVEPGPKSPGGFACDTEFESGRMLTIADILSEAARVGGECRWIICTGGEPLLQLDDELIAALHSAGYQIAIETNGTRKIPAGIDWVSVSPKVAEHALKAEYADELRYVRAHGQAIPKPALKAAYKFISPAWSAEGLSQENLTWCLGLVKEHPEWRISLQLHKMMGVR